MAFEGQLNHIYEHATAGMWQYEWRAPVTTDAQQRARARDAIMLITLLVWLVYAVAAVVQLFTSGAKVLDSLPPFWWWGIPLAPYSALYQPWSRTGPAVVEPAASEPPQPPAAPGAA